MGECSGDGTASVLGERGWRGGGFRQIFEATPTAMLVVDRDGVIVLANREAERLFAKPRERLVGAAVESLVPAASRERHPEQRRAFFARPEARPMGAGRDLFALRGDGREVPVEIGLTPLEADDGVYILSAIIDISERKRAEDALRDSNRRLESALAELAAAQGQLVEKERLSALGRLASGIAHDLNNTLAPILGYSELLLERAENLAPRLIADLRTTNLAARDAAGVVRRLREFYLPRAPNQTPSLLHVAELVQEAVAMASPKWKDEKQAAGATVVIRTRFESAPPIKGDAAELREALLNLILNALDAMPSGGVLSFATALAEDGVVIRVKDDGVGMPEEVRRRCFEPFFSTKGERGTGLGLAQVYGAVRRHGGSVAVESRPGAGTEFTLVFPPADDAAAGRPVREPRAVPPLRVLLVDDEPLAGQVLLRYLELDGHRVEFAANGRLALLSLDRATFDLVVTDYAMPDLNGERFAEAVKARFPTLPVIMVTGFGAVMSEQEGAALKPSPFVDCVLSKPVTLSEWRRTLAELWAGRD
jgi:PAS domain S-box-containing protein